MLIDGTVLIVCNKNTDNLLGDMIIYLPLDANQTIVMCIMLQHLFNRLMSLQGQIIMTPLEYLLSVVTVVENSDVL